MAVLVEVYRGNVLEDKHHGRICIVNENGEVCAKVGNIDTITYFRSSSKPIQALPILVNGLDSLYGLTGKEIAIMAGSHAGEQVHLDVLETILRKTGFCEEQLVMLPAYPANASMREDMLINRIPPRILLHNCAGKHLACMMLAKHLTQYTENYWEIENAAQQEILQFISCFSEFPVKSIQIGVDGCGVPVFAVPQTQIAIAYLNMACPDRLADSNIRHAAEKMTLMMNRHYQMIRGTAYLCSIMNMDRNIVAKGGANGVYGFGLKKERLGISLKIEDGTEHIWPLVIAEILRQIHYDGEETIKRLERLFSPCVYNVNKTRVGTYKTIFKL